MDPQLTSQIVPLEEVRQIEDCLARLVEDTSGNYVLLLDKSGQVIASQGDANRQDITALGALIASIRVVARGGQAAARKDFRNMFQQGVRDNIFPGFDRRSVDSLYHLQQGYAHRPRQSADEEGHR